MTILFEKYFCLTWPQEETPQIQHSSESPKQVARDPIKLHKKIKFGTKISNLNVKKQQETSSITQQKNIFNETKLRDIESSETDAATFKPVRQEITISPFQIKLVVEDNNEGKNPINYTK